MNTNTKKAVYKKKYIILECQHKGKLRYIQDTRGYGMPSWHDDEFDSEEEALTYAGKNDFHFHFVIVPKFVRNYFPE